MITAESGIKMVTVLDAILVIHLKMENANWYQMEDYQILMRIVPSGKIYNVKNAHRELFLDQSDYAFL